MFEMSFFLIGLVFGALLVQSGDLLFDDILWMVNLFVLPSIWGS